MSRRVWAALVVVTVSLVYLFRVDRTAGLMVDDAWYIVLAQALASGEGYRLISSATVPIMPVVPPGFPLLLAPVFLLDSHFPDNLVLLKAISIAAMAGVGVATFHYAVKCRQLPEWVAATVATATVLTPALVFLATSTVMAEAAFTLAQVLAVILLDRDRGEASGVRWSVAAGAMAAVAVLLRSAGIAVVLGGVMYLLWTGAWRRAAAFAATAGVCLAPWLFYSAAHAPTAEQSASHGGTIAYAYSELLSMRRTGATGAGQAGTGELLARIPRNLVNVFGRDVGGVFVPGLYRGPSESGEETVGLGGAGASMGAAPATVVVSFAISAVLLAGLIVNVRTRLSAADALVVVSLGMILLVPTRTFRYVLPLAPFLWLYLATSLRAAAAVVSRLRGRDVGPAAGIVLFSLVGLQLLDHVQYSFSKAAEPPVASWLADARDVDEVLAWMDQHLPAGAPVAASNPGLVYLRTGRKAVAASDPGGNLHAWREAGIHYIVSVQPAALPAKSLGLTTLFANRGRWVVAVPVPNRTAQFVSSTPTAFDNY